MTGFALSQPPALTPTLDDRVDETSVLGLHEGCTCPACIQERPFTARTPGDGGYRGACRMPNCSLVTLNGDGSAESAIGLHRYSIIAHERSHYFHQDKYRCAEKDCTASFKQWRDLKRHYRAKHYTKTPAFPCNVIGCQYGGENGFHRKDKLTSHYKNVHQAVPLLQNSNPVSCQLQLEAWRLGPALETSGKEICL